MDILYALTIYDCSDDYRQGFFIGIFSAYEKARETAERYLHEIHGFKDYPCEYEIARKKLIGEPDPSGSVYMIWGWNLNEDLDEIDILESDVYTVHECAEEKCAALQKEYERQEWCVDRYIIDEAHWNDGFERK